MPLFRILVALLALAVAPVSWAGPATPGSLSLRFEWVEGGAGAGRDEAFIDAGSVAARASRAGARPILIQRAVSLRLEGAASTARVSVWLGSQAAGTSVRVDGQPVGLAPVLVDAMHRVGTAVVHRIEISIPPGVAPGPFLATLRWSAETS